MPRIVIEVDGDLDLVESLLQPAIEANQVRLFGLYYTKTPPSGSIVDDWRESAKQLNEFVDSRIGRGNRVKT